jgi:hypothetical protein
MAPLAVEAADAGVLLAPERTGRQIDHRLIVDVRHPHLHLLRKPGAAGQIGREHRSRETVLCPIRDGERIILATGRE